MKDKKLEFYVLRYDINGKEVVYYNIFNNINVNRSIKEEVIAYLKNKDDIGYFYNELSGFEALVKRIDDIIKWALHCKAEYEISVGSLFAEDKNEKLEKWDCYMQVQPNIELITKLCLDYFSSDI